MKLKAALFGLVALIFGAAAIPAQAAKLERFWIHNFSHFDIYMVYALQDQGHGTRDLMGSSGHLDYNPAKVPDSVLVLAPNRGSSGCWSEVKVVGYYPNSDDSEVAWFSRINLCVPGQSISVFDSDFN